MTVIYYCYIDLAEDIYTILDDYFNSDIMEHLNHKKNIKQRFLSEIGIALAYKETGKSYNEKMFFTEKGKPYFENGPYFNISHTSNYVFVAISDKKIGIDAEKKRIIPNRLVERFFSKKDRYFLKNNPNEFFTLWTIKEAYSKLKGSGIDADFAEFDSSEVIDKKMCNGIFFYTTLIEEIPFAAAFYEKEISIDVKKIDMKELI